MDDSDVSEDEKLENP